MVQSSAPLIPEISSLEDQWCTVTELWWKCSGGLIIAGQAGTIQIKHRSLGFGPYWLVLLSLKRATDFGWSQSSIKVWDVLLAAEQKHCAPKVISKDLIKSTGRIGVFKWVQVSSQKLRLELQEAWHCQDDAEQDPHTVKTALVYLAFSLSRHGNAKSSEKLKAKETALKSQEWASGQMLATKIQRLFFA